jgi:RNA polymerase sigma-70 factor (ECF subfamily)
VLRRHGIGSDAQAGRRLPAPQDEVALVSRVAQGDAAAFDALFRRYAPRLIRFLGRTTRGGHLIDEIVNDTMFVVWRKARTFNRCSKVSTWILGIASRRRLKTLERVDDRTGAVDIDELAAPAGCGPEAQFIRQDLQRCLRNAIDALPAEQRRVVMLTYFDGRTYAEIAEIVGCPVNTVKTRMFHARRRLKILLEDGRRVA